MPGVFSDKQKMFLFYEMAVWNLGESDKQSLFDSLSEGLQTAYVEHRPQNLLPSEADSKGVASKAAILTVYPRFVEDKTVFNGFIMIPISTGKSMTFVMIPIMDQYDIYELTDESSAENEIAFQTVEVGNMADKDTLHISSHSLEFNGPGEMTVYWGATERQKPTGGSMYKVKKLE